MVTHADIITSVNNGLILDEFIRQGTFLRNGRGRLIQYTGGFTDVFPVDVHGQKWAFRCWHASLGSTQKRFSKISAALSQVSLPYFCEFKYVYEGIIINGLKYPTTRMQWVDGDNIKTFLCKHKNEKKRLEHLADSFMKMAQDLHTNHIAHGDLQHGNIIVGNDDHLYLIDYDSIYVPSLKGEADIIQGLKGYQHPKRNNNKLANEKLDYFSELVIYMSILGIAANPDLVGKYKVEDSDQLLFSFDDFQNIVGSEIYNDLTYLGGIFPILLKILVDYLSKNDINDLEPFEDLLTQYYKDSEIKAFGFEEGTTLVKGEKATLRWDVENVSELYLNGKKLPTNARSYEIDNDNTGMKTYTLHIVNGIKQKTASIDVEVVEGAIIEFNADKKRLKQGKEHSAKLSWHIRHAKHAKLIYENQIETISLNGHKQIDCYNTTNFEIDAVNLDGKSHVRKSIRIEVCKECKIEFSADKEYTLPNVPVQLSWNVTNSKTINLNGNTVESQGNLVVAPNKNTEYKLSAHDAFGVTSKSIIVRMLPIPVVKTIMVPTPYIEKNIKIEDNIPRINVNIDVNAQATNSSLNLEIPNFESCYPEFVQPIFNINEVDNIGLHQRIETALVTIKNKLKKLSGHGRK